MTPHPPLLIPEVGRQDRRRVAGTVEAMQQAARLVAESHPQALVLVSPHAPLFRDAMTLHCAARLSGTFAQFGAPQVEVSFPGDEELAEALAADLAPILREAGLELVVIERQGRAYGLHPELDHGSAVPLYFLQEAGLQVPLVDMSFALASEETLYRMGQQIAATAARLGRRFAFIASGDLSHRLLPEAPAGYSPRGREFDAEFTAKMRQGDALGVMGMDPGLRQEAGECGYRSAVMMLGALDGWGVEEAAFHYEGPFGVGYGVIALRPTAPDPQRRFLEAWHQKRREQMERRRAQESFPVRLARQTVEEYVRNRRVMAPPPEDQVPAELAHRRAGAFVSLHAHGELRGCIGTIAPTEPDLVREIIANAIKAATEDPRFSPVQPAELADLEYSVDVLSEPEPVKDESQLDPKRYGVIVRSGFRQGLLLPDLEGVDSVAQQLDIARRKAGIRPGEKVELLRFTVTRYK
ncbi:MAG: AmmeMemoRadiSam system protein A [Firmicutes bacterium]|nr:AmmeMemoRadiSam system protein A [Bacillota bacterium]